MANTINWNAPTIKAGKISGRGTGGSTATPNWTNIGRDIASIGQSIAAGVKVREQNIRYEKEKQLQLLKERNQRNELLYDKVAQIDTLPNNTFEQSKNQMLYGLMDKYIKIKNAMDDPNSGLDLGVGRKALEEINASVSKYKTYAPLILGAANELKTALAKPFGTPGAIAGGVPTEQQKLLLNLIEGGDVQIADRDGAFYLYNTDEKGNVQNVFNIDEYMRVTKNGTEPYNYFREIIDTSEEDKGAVAILGTPQNPMSTYYDYETDTSADGKTEIRNLTWKTDQGVPVGKEAAIKNVAASGFNYLIEDPKAKQDMEDLWNDVIGIDSKGITGQDIVWDPQDKTKRTYQVKGYINDQGQFVFDPKGDTTQTYKDVFGNELKLTQSEFAKRWLAENAIHSYAPTPMTQVGVTKTTKDDKGYSYDMYEGYVNTQRKIQKALKAGEDITSLSVPLMREGSTKGWRLKPSSTGKSAVWEHVELMDEIAPDNTTKIKVWRPIQGEPTINAVGEWPGMKSATKQYRVKN